MFRKQDNGIRISACKVHKTFLKQFDNKYPQIEPEEQAVELSDEEDEIELGFSR